MNFGYLQFSVTGKFNSKAKHLMQRPVQRDGDKEMANKLLNLAGPYSRIDQSQRA